jgi:hypothetical protein
MNYTKPEVTMLGPASVAIQGSKSQFQELGTVHPQRNTIDCELDD